MNSTSFLVNCTTIFVILSVPLGPDVSPILRRRPAAEPLEGALKCSRVTKLHLTGSLIDREVLRAPIAEPLAPPVALQRQKINSSRFQLVFLVCGRADRLQQ